MGYTVPLYSRLLLLLNHIFRPECLPALLTGTNTNERAVQRVREGNTAYFTNV